MRARVFIVHGWAGYSDHNWKGWLKRELEKQNITVVAPAMPDTDNPTMDKWVNHLKEAVGKPDKDCYFVGHSLGCITILRYIESLNEGEKVGGAVLVAGFSDNIGFKELDTFFQTPIYWGEIKSHCGKFVAIHSDNDKQVPLKHSSIFKQNLNAHIIIEHNMHHFSGNDGINELPVALKELEKMMK